MLFTIFIKLIPFSSLKIFFLRFKGAKIGKNVKIGYLSTIHSSDYSKITIGDFVQIGYNSNIKVSKLNIGNFSIVGNNAQIDGGGELIVGRGCYIPGLFIDTSGGVLVGNFSALPPNGNIYSHNYSRTWYNPGSKYELYNINIGNRVWMGAGSSLLNANIGDETLIAAGSIVLQDIPKNSFAIGNPARVLKTNTYNKIDKTLFENKIFQKDIIKSYGKNKILFVNEFNEIMSNIDLVVCNICSINPKKVNATILEIDKNHIHNMKKEVLSTVKELRSWGIFLSY